MPGIGCPLRDNGFIVQMGLKTVGDSIFVEGMVALSSTRGARTSSSASGFELVLYRLAEVWKLARVRSTWIT
jgi:hypothetical protein